MASSFHHLELDLASRWEVLDLTGHISGKTHELTDGNGADVRNIVLATQDSRGLQAKAPTHGLRTILDLRYIHEPRHFPVANEVAVTGKAFIRLRGFRYAFTFQFFWANAPVLSL